MQWSASRSGRSLPSQSGPFEEERNLLLPAAGIEKFSNSEPVAQSLHQLSYPGSNVDVNQPTRGLSPYEVYRFVQCSRVLYTRTPTMNHHTITQFIAIRHFKRFSSQAVTSDEKRPPPAVRQNNVCINTHLVKHSPD
jgi:hypothetical protein